MSQVLKYAIVRYYPWSERDEFINVGVVLESSLGVVYRFVEPRTYHLRTVLERDEVEELWEVFDFSLFGTRELARGKVQRESRVPRSLSIPLERCLGELSGELQCSDMRTIFVERDDPHLVLEYLNSLFDRQVVRHVKKPKRGYLERGRLLKSRLRRDLDHWHVLERLLPAQDLIVTVAWPMDFLYRLDGSESGIQVLDCGLKRTGDAIRIAYGATRDIEESKRENVSVIGVVGNRDANPRVFDLVNKVLRNREPALKFIEYDTEQGKDTLRRILQAGEISRGLLIP